MSNIILPGRKFVEPLDFNQTTTDVLAIGWNACLDEVARLNPCRAQAVACVACEGHPMGGNNPCAVCGGAQAVPDGYVLVPVDPTPEMLDRYPFNVSAATSEPMDKEDLRVVYQAMIAAAPSAKKED